MPKYQVKEVSLELSNRCLAKCKHCSSDSRDDAYLGDELSFDDWRRVISQAFSLGAEVISLSGGEPLLYPYWRDVVSYIARLGMGILFYTCGITEIQEIRTMGASPDCNRLIVSRLMPEDILLHLKGAFQRSWGKAIFSLEGADSVVHDEIVGITGSFSNTLSCIRRALELEIPVEVHFTPQVDNWLQIPDFLRLARRLEVDKVSFLRLVPQGRAKTNNLMYSPLEFVLIQRMLYDWEGDPKFRIGCPLSFGHLLGYIDERPRCHAGKDLMLIRPNGDIHACAGWKECQSLVLGNVLEHALSTIWELSRDLEMIRAFHEQNLAMGECLRCPWKSCCGGGCPAQRVIHNQNQKEDTITEIYDLSESAKTVIKTRTNWQLLIDGVDPMCPRYTRVLTDSDIKHHRRNTPAREQDNEGNVVR